MVGYSAWLGAGALTIGVGAAALACSGAANADAGTGSSARHNVSASHSPRTAAHQGPRTKPTAALIAASTVTGVANHKPRPSTVTSRHATTSSAPPTIQAHAAPNLTDLLGRLVQLGSAIQNFDVVHAVHGVVQTVTSTARHAVQTVVAAVGTVFAGIANAVLAVAFVVALPVEIPLGFYFLYQLVQSPLWF